MCARDQTGGPASPTRSGSAPAGPRILRGGRSPSLRPGRLDGTRPALLPTGLGRGTRPRREERTVRPGGRGDRRRSGGDAAHAARRSLRGLSREADGHRPAVIGSLSIRWTARSARLNLAGRRLVDQCGKGRRGPGRPLPLPLRAARSFCLLPVRRWEGGLDPGGRDGRSPSRRPGGPAPKRWQCRPCRPPVTRRTQPKPMASVGGDRWPAGEHPAAGRPGNVQTPRKWAESPTANGAGAGVPRGIEGGWSTPHQPRCYLEYAGPVQDA